MNDTTGQRLAATGLPPISQGYAIVGEWLVETTPACTCAGDDHGHEPHCGTEPIGKVEDLLRDAARLAAVEEAHGTTVIDLADARATEAVLRGEIRRSESALATFDDLAARLVAAEERVAEWERWADHATAELGAALHPDPSEEDK